MALPTFTLGWLRPGSRPVTASDPGGPQAALESLATALNPREFAAILVAEAGCRPCLTVASRRTSAAENIYADRSVYWWSWVEPIAATSDPLAAAYRVTAVLGAVSGAR
jgi:hypothetical protein